MIEHLFQMANRAEFNRSLAIITGKRETVWMYAAFAEECRAFARDLMAF